MTLSAYNGTSVQSQRLWGLIYATGITQWGRLGEILGGVRCPCAAPAAVQMYAQGSGSSVKYGQDKNEGAAFNVTNEQYTTQPPFIKRNQGASVSRA